MKLFEGKSKTERNKLIAAIVLGLMCLVVFYFAFGRGLFGGSSTTATIKPSPSPKTNSVRSNDNNRDKQMPSQGDQDFTYQTQPIVYSSRIFIAPDPGRNIFAFYEPPLPCRENCPTPVPPPVVIKTPIPVPPPPVQIAFINPQSVYAGSKGFRLELAGDLFTPEMGVYFGQQLMPTTFVNAQRMTADIPGVLIAGDGAKPVIVQTADGKLYSNQVMLEVQPAPKPQWQYIGMIARTRGNNDTAYFLEAGKPVPVGFRLNDVIEGRFRLLSISEKETLLEDINLGFKHRVPLFTPPAGTVTSPVPGRPGFPTRESRETYVPYNPPPPASTNSRIPGIPDNIPRYVPPSNSNRMPANTKKDVDDDEDTDN
ncbi:MAG: hypothetical protein WBD27_13715 [Pyrinomonadaceae bacterium]